MRVVQNYFTTYGLLAALLGSVFASSTCLGQLGDIIDPLSGASTSANFEWRVDGIAPVGADNSLIRLTLQLNPLSSTTIHSFDGVLGGTFHQEWPLDGGSVPRPTADTGDLFQLGFGPSTVDTHFLDPSRINYVPAIVLPAPSDPPLDPPIQTPGTNDLLVLMGDTSNGNGMIELNEIRLSEDALTPSSDPGDFGAASEKNFGSTLSGTFAKVASSGTWDLAQLVIPNDPTTQTITVGTTVAGVAPGSVLIEEDFTFDFSLESTLVAAGLVVPGDMNGDGLVNGLDVLPFVDGLINPPAYDAVFPLLNREVRGDVNNDTVFNGLDVQPFVDLVLGISGGLSLDGDMVSHLESIGASVPEPGTISGLAVLVLVCQCGGRRRGRC